MNNNLVYRGMKYFWHAFICNLAFVMGNGVLVLAFLSVKFSSLGILVYLIGGILLFPNLLALFATMRGVIVKQRETKLFRRYFIDLKLNFKLGMKLAIPYLGLTLISVTNLIFLGQNGLNGFAPFFLVILILLALHLLTVLTIEAELIIEPKAAAKLGFYLISKHGIRSLIGVMMLFMIVIMWQFGLQYFILLGFATLAAGAILLYRSPLKDAVNTLSGRDKERDRELMRQLL